MAEKRCYTEMRCPSFFYGEGDCETIEHDLRIIEGDLSEDTNGVLSALLIQLNTDKFFNGESGFWADQFEGFNIGSDFWKINGSNNFDELPVLVDEFARDAINPLIDQGFIDEVSVRTVRVVGGVQAFIDVLKDGQSLLRFSFG